MKALFLTIFGLSLIFAKPTVITPETREVGHFDKLLVKGSINVTVKRAASEKVIVHAPEDLKKSVITQVEDGVLHIYVNEDKSERSFWEQWDTFFDDEDLTVTVFAPQIKDVTLQGSGSIVGSGTFGGRSAKVTLRGSGDIVFSFDATTIDATLLGSGDIKLNANAELLNASVKGSGDMILSGTVQILEAKVMGSGDMVATDLKASDCKASVTGSGDISLFVTRNLEATVAGSGDIVYKGKPNLTNKNVNGSGEITSAD